MVFDDQYLRVSGNLVPWGHVFSPRADARISPVVIHVRRLLRATPPLEEADVFHLTLNAGIRHMLAALPIPGQPINVDFMRPKMFEVIGAVSMEVAPLARRLDLDPDGLLLCSFLFGDSMQDFAHAEPEHVGVMDAYRRACKARAERALDVFTEHQRGWIRERVVPSQTREGRKDPALAAIFEWESRSLQESLAPLVVSPEQATHEFLRQLKRKGWEDLIVDEEQRGGVDGLDALAIYRDYLLSDAASKPASHHSFWGSDGKIHANSKLYADRFVDQAKRERRQRPTADGGDHLDESPASGPENPLEAAVAAEQAVRAQRVVAKLRQFCAVRGASYLAALARHNKEYRSVRAAAEAHGVTEKAVRYAIGKVEHKAHRLVREISEKI